MDVAIGLPATIPGVEGDQVLEWARRAEARDFSSLGTIDRVVYRNYEPLLARGGRRGDRADPPGDDRPAGAAPLERRPPREAGGHRRPPVERAPGARRRR